MVFIFSGMADLLAVSLINGSFGCCYWRLSSRFGCSALQMTRILRQDSIHILLPLLLPGEIDTLTAKTGPFP